MKIVAIFEEHLYSFVYKSGEGHYRENEYDRLMELWSDVGYLEQYAIDNGIKDIDQFINDRLRDAENIEDLLEEIVAQENPLEYYFQPLSNSEMGEVILSLQKGKVSRWDGLRIYALRIGQNCFVVTGGAIKMSQAMQDHPDTNRELNKLKAAQKYLKRQGVFDIDSFYEFKEE